MCLKVVFLSGLLTFSCAVAKKFPPHFIFGAATSAYQIEGGWNASGKGVSLWDSWVHDHPESIEDHSTGDVAADSYHKWNEDVGACAEMGLNFYRFSLSWTRILPTGFSNYINPDGVEYYNNLINSLLHNNIQPMVTIYHWDLPVKLQELGGWTNPLIIDWFASYVEVVYSLFADRVKFWITINEPAVICDMSYSPFLAPCINERIMAPYICNKNILLAHAKAWRLYDEKYKPIYHGRVSLANHLVWFEPADKEMKETTEMARELLAGRYSHPIYSAEGGWPPKIEELIATLSRNEGFNSSRLPAFTHKEKEFIRGTHDFYGANHYTTRLIRRRRPDEEHGLWFLSGSPELDIILEFDPKWEKGASSLFAVYPQGIRRQLAWIKKMYGDVDIIITENGYSNADFVINDHRRIHFIHDYLEQILLSIKIDEVNVIGYTYWSLIDNFEWMDGYGKRFGLYEINFNDPERRRTARDSAKYYAAVIKSKTIIHPMVHLKQIYNKERHRRKQPLVQNGGSLTIQNGGSAAVQNGGIILKLEVLILFTIALL